MNKSYQNLLMKYSAGPLLGLFFLAVSVNANGVMQESPVYTKVVEGAEYAELLQAVKEIIQGRGINIAHTLPPSDMLQRTGPAFGVSRQVLKNGEIIEFCSAKISHQLIQANVENITLCPFTISVYELNSDPGKIRLTFRKPFIIDEVSREAVEAMAALLKGIIEEAAEW